MNLSAPSNRKIASNLAWTPSGLVRDPLLVLDASGHILSLGVCSEPDREASTEFYSGVIIPNFPVDFQLVFSEMLARRQTPLEEQLVQLIPVTPGIVVVISGLDYSTMRLTDRSLIRKL